MKKILLPFIFSVTIAFAANAQTPALNKQQTVEYISKLYSTARIGQDPVASVGLERRILIINYKDGDIIRQEFYNKKLIIQNSEIGFFRVNDVEGKTILTNIRLESDANRLKKALEHLIELVKAEKSTDPFDN